VAAAPVPLDLRAFRALRSPFEINIYVWLTWRFLRLRKPVTIARTPVRLGYLGGGRTLLCLILPSEHQGDRRFRYDAETCLVLGVPVPFECEAHPAPDGPLLGIRIDIDLPSLHGLVARFSGRLGFEERNPATVQLGVEPVRMAGPLLAATRRLLESLRDPIDRQVVGPAAVEEIICRVLRCDQGRVLYALTRHHTPFASVARALERMHRDYQESLTVDELARESAMGVSFFHRAFKSTVDSNVEALNVPGSVRVTIDLIRRTHKGSSDAGRQLQGDKK
jgi:hypothetical protein